jgi:hypothetical protein
MGKEIGYLRVSPRCRGKFRGDLGSPREFHEPLNLCQTEWALPAADRAEGLGFDESISPGSPLFANGCSPAFTAFFGLIVPLQEMPNPDS